MARSIRVLPVVALIFAVAPAAVAAEDAGYRYEFDDELLHSAVWQDQDLVVKGHGKYPRTALLRPRSSFVVEVLKSVEAI